MKTSLRYRLTLALLRRRGRRFQDAQGFMSSAQAEATRSFRPSRYACHHLLVQPVHRASCQTWLLSPKEEGAASSVHVLYLHGGAFVFGPTWAHWRFLCRLVRSTGCTVHVPVYPRAPQYSYLETQAALEDAYRHSLAIAQGRPMVLAGDSAGGSLALWLAQHAVRRKLRPPNQLILISPCADLSLDSPDIAEFEKRDPWLSTDGLRRAFRLWLRGTLPAAANVSPLEEDLSRLPPTQVYAGDRDLLFPDGERLAQRLKAFGVNSQLRVGQGMCHVWPLLPIPEAREAEEAIWQAVRTVAVSLAHTTHPLNLEYR